MNELLTAITTIISGSLLESAVGGRIYLDEAPEGTVLPYVVFSVVSSVPERTFTERYTNTFIQFSIFSSSKGAEEITNIYTHLKALFDECSLTISGSTLVWMRESNLMSMIDEVTTPTGTAGVKHWAVDFEILTSLN